VELDYHGDRHLQRISDPNATLISNGPELCDEVGGLLLELWFLLDVGFNLRCGYYDEGSCEFVMESDLLIERYLRGWFTIDVLSSAPTTFITLVFPVVDSCGV
jgi:hypothetical protein